jgi:mRNA-degrading endonuclease RelE of RelBE toxin-antitoxin system
LSDEPWRLVVAGPAARKLEVLPARYATAVIETLGAIEANPHRLGKPLRFELTGRWSARRGPYRIIYSIDETTHTITVLAIAHRADIYRGR